MMTDHTHTQRIDVPWFERQIVPVGIKPLVQQLEAMFTWRDGDGVIAPSRNLPSKDAVDHDHGIFRLRLNDEQRALTLGSLLSSLNGP